MDPALYPRMAAVEDEHWWFAGRRAICERLLDRVALPAGAKILEPGCGTGGNFPMLSRRGELFAMDSDPSALGFAASRKMARLAAGSLPAHIPFEGINFDLVVMTDVLEHLDEQTESLEAVHRRLKPGGWLVMTVPALQWLWSEHDETHHHRRRYNFRQLAGLLQACGFAVDYLSYYNVVLFAPIAAVRAIHRLRGSNGSGDGHDLSMPPPKLNALLLRLFASERYVLGRLRIPIGVSLIALARA